MAGDPFGGAGDNSSSEGAPVGTPEGLTARNGAPEGGSDSSGAVVSVGDGDTGAGSSTPTLNEQHSSISVSSSRQSQIVTAQSGAKMLINQYTVSNNGDSPVDSSTQIQFNVTQNGKAAQEVSKEEYPSLDNAAAGSMIPPEKTITFQKAWVFRESGTVEVKVVDADTGASLLRDTYTITV